MNGPILHEGTQVIHNSIYYSIHLMLQLFYKDIMSDLSHWLPSLVNKTERRQASEEHWKNPPSSVFLDLAMTGQSEAEKVREISETRFKNHMYEECFFQNTYKKISWWWVHLLKLITSCLSTPSGNKRNWRIRDFTPRYGKKCSNRDWTIWKLIMEYFWRFNYFICFWYESVSTFYWVPTK